MSKNYIDEYKTKQDNTKVIVPKYKKASPTYS